MTKEKYMALADFQTLWDDKLKPWINGQKADKTDVNALADAIGIDTDYEFVDLGLPSGTLWAKCNIGATVETDYGNYYMYGKGATQYVNGDTPYAGTENPLAAEADTATQVMGEGWHMPTKAQFEELFDETNKKFTSINGVRGVKFTNKTDATKYIFIPASGFIENGETKTAGEQSFCWTSTPRNSANAYRMLYSNARGIISDTARTIGIPVRPVCDSSLYLLADIQGELADKADKSELPTYATPAECRAIVTGYTPSE